MTKSIIKLTVETNDDIPNTKPSVKQCCNNVAHILVVEIL